MTGIRLHVYHIFHLDCSLFPNSDGRWCSKRVSPALTWDWFELPTSRYSLDVPLISQTHPPATKKGLTEQLERRAPAKNNPRAAGGYKVTLKPPCANLYPCEAPLTLGGICCLCPPAPRSAWLFPLLFCSPLPRHPQTPLCNAVTPAAPNFPPHVNSQVLFCFFVLFSNFFFLEGFQFVDYVGQETSQDNCSIGHSLNGIWIIYWLGHCLVDTDWISGGFAYSLQSVLYVEALPPSQRIIPEIKSSYHHGWR